MSYMPTESEPTLFSDADLQEDLNTIKAAIGSFQLEIEVVAKAMTRLGDLIVQLNEILSFGTATSQVRPDHSRELLV
jgi:hypothetical protein